MRAVRLLGIAAAVAAAGLSARVLPEIITKGDLAVAELYVLLAARGQLLVGPYSRFGWHHPGPLYFWLQGPLYVVGGQRGVALFVGAMMINLAAYAAMARVLLRERRLALAGCVLAASVWFAWRNRWLLASPWTAHVAIVACMALIVTTAAAAAGRIEKWPLALAIASFAAQTHVALVPIAASVLLAGAAVLLANLRAERLAYVQAPNYTSCRRPGSVLAWSAFVIAVLWAAPLFEQVTRSSGNLSRLWEFFRTATSGTHRFGTVALWSYALVGPLRPDFNTPSGAHFELTSLGWGVPVAITEVMALCGSALRAWRRRESFDAALAAMCVAASLAALLSIRHIVDDVLDHEVFWISAVGAINLGVIAAAAITMLPARSAGGGLRPYRAELLCTAAVVAAFAIGVRDLRRSIGFESSRRRENAMVTDTYDATRRYLDANAVRRPLIELDDAWDVGASMIVRLTRDRRHAAVEDAWLPMFTDAFATNGREDAVITIGRQGTHQDRAKRPGNETLLEISLLYVDAAPRTPRSPNQVR